MLITDLQVSTLLNASGNNLLPTKTTLTGTTAAVQLHAQLIPAAGTANRDNRPNLQIFVAVSPFSIVAALAPFVLREQATSFNMKPNQENDGTGKIKLSELVPAVGTYCYVWADVPTYSLPPTLNLKLAELN